MKKSILAALAFATLLSCGQAPKQDCCQTATTCTKEVTTLSGLKMSDFSSEIQGKAVALYVLKNKKGAEVCVTNYGGRIVSIMVPNKEGKLVDVVLGYDNLDEYLISRGNYGAFIGRYGNRIGGAKFELDGKEYTLEINNSNLNCLHGGPKAGFDNRILKAKQINDQTLEMSMLSPDGDGGFPGNLQIKLVYTWTDDNALDIQYHATTDKPTVCNLTNHSYFNLSGVAGSQITDHIAMINADQYTEVNEVMIPTGKLPKVDGTPMDLRKPLVISENVDKPFKQLVLGRGFDHNWVLNTKGDVSKLAAKAVHPGSGIGLEVYTNEPGIQLYTGNFMSGNDLGKHGVKYPQRGALCFETQHYPDSPHQPSFPTTTLRPGEKYFSQCIYKFTVEK